MKHGLLAVLAATAAEIVLAGLAMEFGKRFAFLFLVVPPCLILAGFVWGAIRPRRYANGVELRRDDDTFNANPDTNGNPAYRGIGQSTLLRIPDGQRPERFWFHGWVYSNYGGWAVLYDIDRGILYGHYSHN